MTLNIEIGRGHHRCFGQRGGSDIVGVDANPIAAVARLNVQRAVVQLGHDRIGAQRRKGSQLAPAQVIFEIQCMPVTVPGQRDARASAGVDNPVEGAVRCAQLVSRLGAGIERGEMGFLLAFKGDIDQHAVGIFQVQATDRIGRHFWRLEVLALSK